MTRVAFLGLGAMGAPMAGRVLDAGHDLRVWNRTPGRDEDLVARGARRAASPAEAASDAEVVVTMVADPPALEAVLFGPDGVSGAIAPGSIVIDMSTVGPTAIRAAAERLDPVAVIDAPVLGSVPHATAGTLTILAGGEGEVLERCAEVLGAMGTVLHVGPSGAGATIKLANNAAGMSTMACMGEVLALTDRAGLDPEVVLDALAMGPLGSFVDRWRDKLTGREARVDFSLTLARKDLALALAEGSRLGLRLTLPEAAVARCDEAIVAGRGSQDNTALVAEIRS
ncbi:MAG TPA: NAD(P)-dependent oxidoreductase [Actinomycetota bacterium]|nr:NAD(P)-dependent oxidoreductase [Actinomycetota bacterium]